MLSKVYLFPYLIIITIIMNGPALWINKMRKRRYINFLQILRRKKKKKKYKSLETKINIGLLCQQITTDLYIRMTHFSTYVPFNWIRPAEQIESQIIWVANSAKLSYTLTIQRNNPQFISFHQLSVYAFEGFFTTDW